MAIFEDDRSERRFVDRFCFYVFLFKGRSSFGSTNIIFIPERHDL